MIEAAGKSEKRQEMKNVHDTYLFLIRGLFGKLSVAYLVQPRQKSEIRCGDHMIQHSFLSSASVLESTPRLLNKMKRTSR